jgi:hypothetical protein
LRQSLIAWATADNNGSLDVGELGKEGFKPKEGKGMNNTTFMGMEIAMRGLYSSQRGMANVSHNVDNANTPGYSRQVLNQKAARPLLVANSAGMLGMGSDVVSVDRVRDQYLDDKYWSEAQYMGEWTVKATVIEDIQTMYNEPQPVDFLKSSVIFTIHCRSFLQIPPTLPHGMR